MAEMDDDDFEEDDTLSLTSEEMNMQGYSIR